MQTGIQGRLDEGKLTPRQLHIAVVALLGLFLDGYDLLILAGALLGIVPHFHLSPIEVGALGTMAFAGMIVGSLIAGPLTDRFGRRPVFFADMLLFAVTALLFAFVNSPIELFVLRFLVGVAIGADMPTSFAIVTEFVPKQNRGMLLAMGNGFWIGGAVVGGLVSLAIFAFVEPVDAWRWILFSAVVPSIAVLLLRRNVPETPRWLLAQGRSNEGAQVLRETGHVGPLGDGAAAPSVGKGLQFSVLFRNRRLLTALVTMSLFWAIINFIGSGILLYTPTVIKTLLTPSAFTALEFGVIINSLVVVANVVSSLWIIERFGRRILALIPSAIIGLSLIAVALASMNAYVVLAGFALTTILNSGLIVGTYYTWGSELFPTSVRGRALGISNAAGKLGSLLGVLQFPILFAISPKWSFLLLAALAFVNVVMIFLVAPETRDVSLDELEAAVPEPVQSSATWARG
jgi:putative MFS transporter